MALLAQAQPLNRPREFRPGTVSRPEQIPASRLRTQLDHLPIQARTRAMNWLRSIHFTDLDLQSLHTDPEGGVFYVDEFPPPAGSSVESPESSEPTLSAAAVPLNPFPVGLAFHSRPGAPNVIYLNFVGATVTNTAWNNSTGRGVIEARPFSTDSDYSTFSDSEQTAIRRIWQRVAEDYAPFNVDVTTEPPSSLGTRTAMVLITRNTDASGANNPSSSAGGVAYVNVFAGFNFNYYRPAWVYHNNLGNSEAYIAEAASHEAGHNMGLSHDGLTSGSDYYGGHGSGEISWGPIMGTGYNRNVSQWSKGEYYLANNTQDDLSVLAGKMGYAADDHSDVLGNATELEFVGTNVSSTTPETDPVNTQRANKGVLQRNTDVDVFVFTTGPGDITFSVNPWITGNSTRGGDLDLALELRDPNDSIVASSNPATQTGAQIQTTVAQGTYYLVIRNSGAGSPLTASPTGYTSYGSLGQYFIKGSVAPVQTVAPTVQLTVNPNNPDWGSVTPRNGSYAEGTSVELVATPATHFEFVGWTNDASGSANPLNLTLDNDRSVTAIFRATMTLNSPTPHWWLAANGVAGNFEAAVNQIGANGIPLWQSYVAGLNPNDPASRLLCEMERTEDGDVIRWNPVSGRTYTVLVSSEILGPFDLLPGATDLPSNTSSVTNAAGDSSSRFYRVEVKNPE